MKLGGKYEVTRVLGEGGMGVVYEAKHGDLGRTVAVKVLRLEAARDQNSVERFRREARVAASLKSPNVAKILDFGTLEDGSPFMVMEHLVGSDLEAEIERYGALSMSESVTLILEACDAVREAHELGVVHRDLKPGNIFLARDGERRVAKVLDFGISKLTAEENVRMTQTQSSFGTPLYMSPEHVRSVKNVDHRTDIWSLGIILYEAVTGRVPFEAETATAVAVAVATDPLVPPSVHRPGLPPSFDAVVARALEKDPARRFQTIDAFTEALAPFAEWGGTLPPGTRRTHVKAETARPTSTRNVAAPPRSRSAAVVALAGAIVIGAAVGAVLYVRMSSVPTPAASAGVANNVHVEPTSDATLTPVPSVSPAAPAVSVAASDPAASGSAPSAGPAVGVGVAPLPIRRTGPVRTTPTAPTAPTVPTTTKPTRGENPILL